LAGGIVEIGRESNAEGGHGERRGLEPNVIEAWRAPRRPTR
jgi:hypothetical protein